ncbi:hypothetical protein LUZ63_013164 [Rhynchospora breviuscula]|uniref:Cytochrome P450 n=1 Tax=Rhynchospora breviuscula TaxID=2022672 RepID=A0A9Q0HKB5_9POAL|nr:hypothetical protein LUZ63_013164 [Rhynchospora breviuscula]
MKTHDAILANRPAIPAANVLLCGCKDIAFSNGSYCRQLRRICKTELFSSKRVKSFSSTRQAVINSLLKTCILVPDNSPVDVSAMMCELTNNIVIRTAFGGKCKKRGVILEIMREVLGCLSGFHLYELFPSLSWLNVNMRRRLARLLSKMDFVMEEILQEHLQKREHRKKGGDELEYDLVDVLINVKEHDDLEEPITMDNIKAVILDLFLAGTDSSATTLIWAMSELVKNPEAMKKIQAEIRQAARENTKFNLNALSCLKLVLKETLRMHPAGPLLLPRQCMKSCKILGYTIPTRARLVVNAWAIGRNPEYWNDPEEFKPERFETSSIEFNGQNFEYLPFGAGRRICVGLEFAMALVEEALASFLLHFDWKL